MKRTKADLFSRKAEHSVLAASKFAKAVEQALTNLREQLPSHTDPKGIAKAVRSYLDCANKPIRVRRGEKEFTVSCLRAVESTELEVVDDDDLERYVLPLILFPDFRLLESTMTELRKSARECALEWKDAEVVLRKNLATLSSGRVPTAKEQGGNQTQRVGHSKLPSQQQDLSQYLDAARLTGRQRDCLSMRWEYGLPIAGIARRLELDRKTVRDHIASGNRKLEQSRVLERVRANRARANLDLD